MVAVEAVVPSIGLAEVDVPVDPVGVSPGTARSEPVKLEPDP